MSDITVAADQLKSIVQRVERLEGEIADLNADKSEIYKEARFNGFDVKAIKKVVSKRKLDERKREEEDAVFDTYWDAVHGSGLVHAHARENIEQFRPSVGASPATDTSLTTREPASRESVVVGERPPVLAHTNSLSQSGYGAATLASSDQRVQGGIPDTANAGPVGVTGGESAATHSPSDDDAIAAVKGNATARLANVADVEPSSSATIDPSEDRPEAQSLGGNVDANAGGYHVDPEATKGHGLVKVSVVRQPLRPLCLKPDQCGGYGDKTCHSCLVAARTTGEAA